MSLKDYLRKAGNQALRLEKGLIEGDYFDYDDDATFLEKGLKNIGSIPFSVLRPGQIISRLGEEQLGGRDFDFGGDEAFDLITAIPAFKALKLAQPKLALKLAKDFKKDFAGKGFKEALDTFSKNSGISTGFLKKGPLPKGTSELKLKNRALKNTVKNLPDPNRTSLNQAANILGFGKGLTKGQRAARLGLSGTAALDKIDDLTDGGDISAEASTPDADTSATPAVSLDNPESKIMSGDIEIKAKPAQPQYNPNKADASLDLARNIGNLRPTDKSPNTSLLRNVQRKALNESNQILKGQYDKAARARAAQAKFDEREENMRSKWNNSRTGKESGISWDQLDDETKQAMRKRANDFFRNQNQTQNQTMQELAAQPVSQSTGSPMSTKYSPVFGEKGFTGYNDTTDGRFIPSAGVGQKDMLNSLVKQDSDDAVKKSMFQDNNPFGSEYRPLASKPIMTGPTPRTDSMMDTINAMPQNEQLDVINSFRRKRGEEDIYNPFA